MNGIGHLSIVCTFSGCNKKLWFLFTPATLPPPLERDEESVKMVSEALNHTNQISLKPGNSIAAECMGGVF
jgi:hypothetical protein